MAFVSDRSGNPQIYILNLTTQRAKRLTRLNWCDSPAWSPTGSGSCSRGARGQGPHRHLHRGRHRNPNPATHPRRRVNENPTWSPDGRFIGFISTRNQKPELFIMDADGSAPHRLAELEGSSTTPNWSQ